MATSFNIEQAVEKHIAAIASEGNLSPDDIKELAGHLIDSVTILTKQGAFRRRGLYGCHETSRHPAAIGKGI